MIEIVADGLSEMLDEVVFIGGATTGIYIDDPASPEPRPTNDVDCVVEVTTRTQYYALEEKLRKLGFTHSQEPKAPICRWIYRSTIVDIMPIDSKILGFTNRWYEEGIKAADTFTL